MFCKDRLGPSDRYNVMNFLDRDSKSFGSQCDALAEAIVSPEHGDNKHFADTARQLVSGIIGQLRSVYPADEQNLGKLRDILTATERPEDPYQFAQEAMVTGESRSIMQKLGRFAAPGARKVKKTPPTCPRR